MLNYSFSVPSFSAAVKKTIRDNALFLFLFLIYLIIGGISLLLLEQGDLLIYFSENRHPFLNTFFKYGTKLAEEWAFLGITFLFLFIRLRYALLIPIIALLVTIVSFLGKSFFQHPRPMTFYKQLGIFQDIELVEGVYVIKGLTSFPSGHTMAGFALFALVAFCIRLKKGMAVLLLFLAITVGLSRIYLVQHFLKDIYLGSILGVLLAILVYSGQLIIQSTESHTTTTSYPL